MDIALIIGVMLGLAAMGGSIAYALFVEGSAGSFMNFLSAPSFGIVFGGMIASIFVAFPMYHVTALGKAIGAVLKPADDKMGPLVDEACDVAEYARKGPADLEKSVDTIKTYYQSQTDSARIVLSKSHLSPRFLFAGCTYRCMANFIGMGIGNYVLEVNPDH